MVLFGIRKQPSNRWHEIQTAKDSVCDGERAKINHSDCFYSVPTKSGVIGAVCIVLLVPCDTLSGHMVESMYTTTFRQDHAKLWFVEKRKNHVRSYLCLSTTQHSPSDRPCSGRASVVTIRG